MDTRERVTRLEDHLFGFGGEQGRLADMEDDVKALRAEVNGENRAMRVEMKAADVRLQGVELFQHKIKWTVASAGALTTFLALLAFKLFEYLTK